MRNNQLNFWPKNYQQCSFILLIIFYSEFYNFILSYFVLLITLISLVSISNLFIGASICLQDCDKYYKKDNKRNYKSNSNVEDIFGFFACCGEVFQKPLTKRNFSQYWQTLYLFL